MRQKTMQRHMTQLGFCAITFASVVACSGNSNLLGILSNNAPALEDSRSDLPDPTKQPQPGGGSGDNDQEMPTVEVAGVNLTADCFDLKMPARAEESAAIECSIKSNTDEEKPDVVKYGQIGLMSSTVGKFHSPVGVSGERHNTDPKAFLVSKQNPMWMSFELPKGEMVALAKKGLSLVVSELTINQKASTLTQTLKVNLHDYFMSHPSCIEDSKEMFIPMRFDLDALHIDVNTDKYNVRWAYTAHPELSKAKDENDKSADISYKKLATLQICDAQFQEPLKFDWSDKSFHQNRRIFTLLRGTNQKHDLVMTNISRVSWVFKISPLAFFPFVSASPSPFEQVVQRANPADSAEEWCVMGQSGCFDAPSRIELNKEYLHLNRIHSKYWSKNINRILMLGDDKESGLLVRVVNAINSGVLKNNGCFPDVPNLIKQGSSLSQTNDESKAQCDQDLPPPPQLNTPLLRIRYVSPTSEKTSSSQ